MHKLVVSKKAEAAHASPLPIRFWLLLALGSGALCAGYAALVLGQASWAEARVALRPSRARLRRMIFFFMSGAFGWWLAY